MKILLGSIICSLLAFAGVASAEVLNPLQVTAAQKQVVANEVDKNTLAEVGGVDQATVQLVTYCRSKNHSSLRTCILKEKRKAVMHDHCGACVVSNDPYIEGIQWGPFNACTACKL